jgi:hypothetical protein
MRFRPSLTDELKKKNLSAQLSREPFISYELPKENAPPPSMTMRQRFQHLYIPGGTGKGKSTQLLNIAVDDILSGHGITVIDPKGDLVTKLMRYIPEARKDQVIYLDTDTPIPFDFLAYEGHTEKDELVEDIVFLLLGDAGNAPRAKSILTTVLYTILNSTEPISFLDIIRFLTDLDRHKEILDKVQDAELKKFWEAGVKKSGIPSDDKLEPIISRFTKYIRNHTLRAVFGTANPPLKLATVMNEKKILLVNLGGASRAALDYGSLIFMKMKQEIFRRHRILTEEERIPHFIFVDEFQKFAHVDGFKDVLEMARSYKIGLTLANLSYTSLPEEIKSGIEIIQNFICFSLSPRDLSFFKYKCDRLKPETLANLDDYFAYYKFGATPGVLTSSSPPPPFPEENFTKYIKDHTAAEYAGGGANRSVDKPASRPAEKMLELGKDDRTILPHRLSERKPKDDT